MTTFTKEQQDILEKDIVFREGSMVYDIWGDVKGSVKGNVEGDVKGNVRGDVKGNVEGNVLGNVLGSVWRSVKGDVLGSVGGNVLGSVEGNVCGNVEGSVKGSVKGSVWGNVKGNVGGKKSSLPEGNATENSCEEDVVYTPNHYSRYAIEPITFIMRNGLNFWRGNIIKYACRAGYKKYDGMDDVNSEITDLEKIKRYCDMRIAQLNGEEVL